eukprot:RCo031911
MVLVEEYKLLAELQRMFGRNKAKGSVWITMKHCTPELRKSGKSRPNRREGGCLVRCNDGKKAFSALIPLKDLPRFQSELSLIMKANMDSLRKKEKRPAAKAAAASASKKHPKKMVSE